MLMRLLIALLCFPLSCLGATQAITIGKASKQTLESRISILGQVESIQSPTVSAEVNARVLETLVKIGDVVTPETLLAKLDASEYDLKVVKAQSEVKRLNALVRMQTLQVKRLHSLLKNRGVDRATYDKAQAEKQSLISQRNYAKAQLRSAKLARQRTEVYSPIHGVVDERTVSVGDYVSIGSPLFKVIGHQQLRVRLPFSETLLGQVAVGNRLRLSARMSDQAVVKSTLTYLRPKIISGTRSLEAFATFENRYHWFPGMSVQADVLLKETPEAIVVPVNAVVDRPAGQVVYVLKDAPAEPKSPLQVEERRVETGQVTRQGVEIKTGLQPDERFAIEGAGFLSDGAQVKVMP